MKNIISTLLKVRLMGIIACIILLTASCANVPKESVALSKSIGVGIEKAHSAHLSTLNTFYIRIQKYNDQWITETYLPKIIKRSTAALSAACANNNDNTEQCATLNNQDIELIMADVIQFRDSMHVALFKNHQELTHLVNEHYNELTTANSEITQLLESVVELSNARKRSVNVLNELVGFNIDLEKIETTVDDFLTKAGTTGAQVSELESNLSAIIDLFKK